MQYNPDRQPFNATTSYSSFFDRKHSNPHEKPQLAPINYPSAYKFNPNTTYCNDFNEKTPNINKSFKPIETIADKGPHDLNTIYRQDYKEKPQPEICPVLKMPSYPQSVSYPNQHVTYNKNSGSWVEKWSLGLFIIHSL